MRLLVQFTGAQSTGKTTLAHRLSKYYGRQGRTVGYIGEASRRLKEAKLIEGVDIAASIRDQIMINGELLLQYYVEIGNSNELVIAERTPICCMAYARELIPEEQDSTEYNYMREQTLRFLRRSLELERDGSKVLTFYCPLNIPFVEDSVRNRESRKVVDKRILEVLEQFGVESITIPPGTEEERFEYVLRRVEKEFD